MLSRLSLLIRKHKSGIIALFAIVLLYGLLFALGITCPIKHLLGISCAGCGMTRACLSALRLDFAAAFSYHPLWVLMPPLLALLIFFGITRRRKATYVVLGAFGVIMIAVYLIRLLLGGGNVVVFAPETGLIFRTLKLIFT